MPWWMVGAAVTEPACCTFLTWTSSAPGCWASMNTGSDPCATSRTRPRRRRPVRTLDDNHCGPGPRPAIWESLMAGITRASGLVLRPAPGMALGCSGRGDRPLGSVPEGIADVAFPYGGRCRSFPPDLACQPGDDRDQAEPLSAGQRPPGQGHRQGLAPRMLLLRGAKRMIPPVRSRPSGRPRNSSEP